MFHPMACTVIAALLARDGARRSPSCRPPWRSFCAAASPERESARRCAALKRVYAPALELALRWRFAVIVRRPRRSRAARGGSSRRAWAASSSRASTRATSRCTRCASPAPASSRRSRCSTRSSAGSASFPRSTNVFAKIGTAEIATDPMPPSVADGFVILKPRDGVAGSAQAEGRARARASRPPCATLPGNNYEFTQPIQMRFNELIAGVRSDVAVKVFGDDLDGARARTPSGSRRSCESVPGAADVKVEQVTGLPMLDDRRRPRGARALRADARATCRRSSQIGVGGRAAGQVFEGDRRFDIVVRLPEDVRGDVAALRAAAGSRSPAAARRSAGARDLPLGAVADVRAHRGPEPDQPRERQAPRRRHGERARPRPRLVRRRGGAAHPRRGRRCRPGYWISWGGQFENLISAGRSACASSCRSRCC